MTMTMKIFFLLFLISFINIQQTSCLPEDYYWRDYTGSIPHDAYVAGQDINGRNVYIGQAYLENVGLIVTQIFPGLSSVKVTFYNNGHPYHITKFIKVLCTSHPENFEWVPGSANNLPSQMASKRPIIGGHEFNSHGYGGVLYVGRLNAEGELKVGKVIAYVTTENTSKLYFVNNSGKEQGSNSYEVLVYNKTATLS